MVIIYTAPWCAFCHGAKHYLETLKVEYDERDVEKDPKHAHEAVDKSGQMGIPVIDIDGTIIIGFDRPRIDMALRTAKLV